MILHVGLHPVGQDTKLVGDVLHHPVRVDIHLSGDPGVGVVEPVKGDHPGVVGANVGLPRHPLIGVLLGDRGAEFPSLPDNVKHPMSGGGIDS